MRISLILCKSDWNSRISYVSAMAGREKDPKRREEETEESEAGTTAGISDPEQVAAIEAQKKVIEEAQAKIASITGGRKSRAGSMASSVVNKGSATIELTRTVHETAKTHVAPTTVIDPVSGSLRVVQTPKPGVFTLGTVRAKPGLMESLPDPPALAQDVIDIADSDDEYDEPSTKEEKEKKPAGPQTRAAAKRASVGESAAKRRTEDSDGNVRKKLRGEQVDEPPATGDGADKATEGKAGPSGKGGHPKPGTSKGMEKKTTGKQGKTRLVMECVETGVHYELFLAQPHSYEVGDDILLKSKDGKETPVTVVIVEDDAMPPPGATIGAVGEEVTEAQMAAARAAARKEKTGASPGTEKARGRKADAPKPSTSAGEAPADRRKKQAAVLVDKKSDDLEGAARARALSDSDGSEPQELSQIWTWTEEKVKRARKLAKEIAEMEDREKVTTRAAARIRELEAILHSKCGSKPKELPQLSEAEQKIKDETVTGRESARELFTRAAKYSRVAAKTALSNQRGIVVCMDKIDTHTRSLVLITEYLADLRRVMTKYDRPVHQQELMANPDLNPYLAGYIPFDDPLLTQEFFESQERIYALNRYVTDKIRWDPSTFIPRLVDLICTPSYRIKFSFPGKQTLTSLVYIPQKLADFLIGAAELAAFDQGGCNPDKVRDQLRVAFQASQVAKRNRPEHDPAKKGKKKPRRGEIFTSSSSEDATADESKESLRMHEDFEDTLVDYESYVSEDKEGVPDVEATIDDD